MEDNNASPYRFCIAPMLDCTDRYCRLFHRILSKRARLYSEMVTTGALLHGDRARHLDFNFSEQPIALQLGGSDPKALAYCAELAQQWGYSEVNINCGCPSDRVQRGDFGACLMEHPHRLAVAYRTMLTAVDIPVTIKHRIGLNKDISYAPLFHFVETLAEAGCKVFIVHARNAVLKGLSPKENREIPPLRYEIVYRLKQDFPMLTIVLNGGVTNLAEASAHLKRVDGVMLGRSAYHNPWLLSQVDSLLFGITDSFTKRQDALRSLKESACESAPISFFTKHLIGLYHTMPGAKLWRQHIVALSKLTNHGWDKLLHNLPHEP